MSPSSSVLVGWKRIAEYAGLRDSAPADSDKGVVTVRRWYMDRGLPVALIRYGRHERAVISTTAFDAWLMLQSKVFRSWRRGKRRLPAQPWLPFMKGFNARARQDADETTR